MLSSGDVVHITLLTVIDTCAFVTNLLYISIILKRTPPLLSNYSPLLLHIACVDLLSSAASLTCCSSLQNADFLVVFSYVGPCTLLGERWCHLSMAAYANSVGASVMLLLLSFAYRLWIVRSPQIENTRQHNLRRKIAQCAITILTLLNAVTFYLGGTYQAPGFDRIRTVFSVVDLTGAIDQHLLARTSFGVLFLIYMVGFFAIFAIRRRLFARISALSNTDANNHQQIYRSLLAQMALPSAYVFATSLWLLDVAGVLRSPMLRRSIIVSSSLFALISPMINMYYIPPYRKYLKSIFISSGQVVQAELSLFTQQTIVKF